MHRTDFKDRINNKSSQYESQLHYQIKLIPERNELELLFMFIYFLGVKLCKFNVIYNPSSSQQYDRH